MKCNNTLIISLYFKNTTDLKIKTIIKRDEKGISILSINKNNNAI